MPEAVAYSLLEVKSTQVTSNRGILKGIASTPTADRADDIVEPDGAEFKLPLPLLWQHRHDQPLGHVTEAKVTKSGIEITAEVILGVTDEIDRAWKMIKAGLVRGLSIGFRGLEAALIQNTYGVHYQKWEWYELSVVTIPANAEANISAVKSAFNDLRRGAASGSGKTSPGVSGTSLNIKPKGVKMPKTIAEQIAALEAKRAAHSARMEEIMQKSVDEGRSTDETEQEEFDSLTAELTAIDGDLKRFRALETAKAYAAKPIQKPVGSVSVDAGAGVPSAVKLHVPQKAGAGIEFARLAKAKALGYLDHRNPLDIAKQLYGEQSLVVGILTKANVVAGSSLSGSWAEDLVGDETSVYADFAEFLRPMTIVGKFGANGVPALRRIPFRTPLISQTGGGLGYWVGEGKPKPLTSFDFDRTTLDELKVAAIAVVTEELLRKSSPSADSILRDSLAAAVVARLDEDFIDPAKAASAGVSPASITNGVSAIASTGNDADAIREDVRQLMATFIAANNAPTSGVWIMSSLTALAISLMVNPLGQPEFPGINMNGGTFLGFPVITSEYFSAVSAGGYIALVNASDIYFADEGGVRVDVSREASLQMLDNPTNDTVTPTATSMVSMFQTNSVAFRAERILNWKKRRASAVALLDEVNWGIPAAS
jgi:HK97 family phage major capsid protein/HK97 family phage prohead protease